MLRIFKEYFIEETDELYLKKSDYLDQDGNILESNSTKNIPTSEVGNIWFDTTSNSLKVKVNGVTYEITATAV